MEQILQSREALEEKVNNARAVLNATDVQMRGQAEPGYREGSRHAAMKAVLNIFDS